jgi:putative heme-binding domain-containing protein
MRAAGFFGAHVEGGGRPSGYFTSASGVTIYRGDAFGEAFAGDAFVAEPAGNLVHRKKLRPAGPLPAAERPADERKREFIASTDGWFRPVQLANAPDGTLYVADMYREIVEHPSSLPDSVKKQFDLGNGNDRGRIWRVVPEGFRRPPPVRLGAAGTAALVKTLEHPNGWHRDTAARLLYERQDRAAVPLLVDLLRRSPSPLGRLHALYALDGLGALAEAHVLRALADPGAGVRAHGVRLAERLLRGGVPSAPLWARLRALAADPSPAVRHQLALTSALIEHADKPRVLRGVLDRDIEHAWSRAAVLNALTTGAGELFAAVSRGRAPRTAGGRHLLRQLAGLVGARNRPAEVRRAAAFIARMSASASSADVTLGFSMTRALGDGLGEAGSSIAGSGLDVGPLLARAKALAAEPARSEEALRLRAVELLALAPYAEASAALLPLVDPAQPEPVQLAALSALGRFAAAPELAPALIARLPRLGPRTRSKLVGVLLEQPARATALLESIAVGVVSRRVLTPAQATVLRSYGDPAVKELAGRLLASPPDARPEAIRRFAAALHLKGNGSHGQAVFEQRCLSCHRLGQSGHALGPDLAAAKAGGREALLHSILDPNRDVMPQYLAYVVDTKDRGTLVGLVAAETAAAVTLRQAFGAETVIPRAQIKSMHNQGASLMPEGLEEGLEPQDLADLLEFIATAGDTAVPPAHL